MSFGVVMLVHEALDRAAQLAAHWARHGAPVVIHLDARVPEPAAQALRTRLAAHDTISFCRRHACDWGRWSLVAATLSGVEQMLARHPEAGHVYLASGACLPLRPVAQLRDYLAARPETDFIESVTTRDVPWTVGGLDEERFTLRFPFSFKRHRRLFDAYVRLQRRVGFRRAIPEGLVPHMGSQWWCLSRPTLERILADPRRAEIDRYFARVWIPDESYFQTLVRRHGTRVESRSLTLFKFDFQGKPHVFYDDHLELLRRSECFVARKIWPGAQRLFDGFLGSDGAVMAGAEPDPGRIERVFARAAEQRTRGRDGLYCQGRLPAPGMDRGKTAAPYTLLSGLAEAFEDFEDWLARASGAQVHGHLYAPEGAQFAGGGAQFAGALGAEATLRDYNPHAFLTSLLWNTRGTRQCFQFGPRDTQAVAGFVAGDPNAGIWVVTGAWALPLARDPRPFEAVRAEAARLQRIEAAHLGLLRAPWVRARVRIRTLADLVENPAEPLREILAEVGGPVPPRPVQAPRLRDLTGFGAFLQRLRNAGMQPYLMGDFPSGDQPEPLRAPARRLYKAG